MVKYEYFYSKPPVTASFKLLTEFHIRPSVNKVILNELESV